MATAKLTFLIRDRIKNGQKLVTFYLLFMPTEWIWPFSRSHFREREETGYDFAFLCLDVSVLPTMSLFILGYSFSLYKLTFDRFRAAEELASSSHHLLTFRPENIVNCLFHSRRTQGQSSAYPFFSLQHPNFYSQDLGSQNLFFAFFPTYVSAFTHFSYAFTLSLPLSSHLPSFIFLQVLYSIFVSPPPYFPTTPHFLLMPVICITPVLSSFPPLSNSSTSSFLSLLPHSFLQNFFPPRSSLPFSLLLLSSIRLWSRRVKSRDVSTGPLARPLARTAHSFACSALVASLARPTALIRLHAHKLTHSHACRKVNDLVLSHSVFALSAFP